MYFYSFVEQLVLPEMDAQPVTCTFSAQRLPVKRDAMCTESTWAANTAWVSQFFGASQCPGDSITTSNHLNGYAAAAEN
jgi:hypothetical protein